MKSTLNILNLIAFLLGSPDYPAVRLDAAPRRRATSTEVLPPKRLAKKAAAG